MTGNDDFGGGPHPLTMTYNAKEQTVTQTDVAQNTETDTVTGRGQWERVAKNDASDSHTYSLLGLTKIIGSTAR